jgi:hypothetical protein
MNLYAYCGNNPINLTDPTGLCGYSGSSPLGLTYSSPLNFGSGSSSLSLNYSSPLNLGSYYGSGNIPIIGYQNPVSTYSGGINMYPSPGYSQPSPINWNTGLNISNGNVSLTSPNSYSNSSNNDGVVQKVNFINHDQAVSLYLNNQLQQIYADANRDLNIAFAQRDREFNASLAQANNSLAQIQPSNPLTFLGNGIRSTVNASATYVENAAISTGFSSLAAPTAFVGSLARSAAGTVAGTIDVPGTVSGIINDVGTSIDYGRKYGWEVGVGRQIGVSQVGEIMAGTDIRTGAAVNYWDKASEAAGRIGSTAGMGAGIAKMVMPAPSVSGSIIIDEYGNLKNSSIPGQAHHLNQTAAYGEIIPKQKGLSIKLEGNILKDVGAPHTLIHESLETFWSQYRGTDIVPTNMQYTLALKQSLRFSNLSETQIQQVVRAAIRERVQYGILGGMDVPHLPDPIWNLAR